MPGTTARVQRKGPVAFRSRWACQLASVVRPSGADSPMPALLTSTSTRPIRSKSAVTAASSLTSQTSSTSPVVRPTETTRSSAKRRQIAAPIPLPPPVTTTVRGTSAAHRDDQVPVLVHPCDLRRGDDQGRDRRPDDRRPLDRVAGAQPLEVVAGHLLQLARLVDPGLHAVDERLAGI